MSDKELAGVERLRDRWIKHMTPVLARQIEPLVTYLKREIRSGTEPSLLPSRIQEKLDNEFTHWMDMVRRLTATVAPAFELDVDKLGHRAGLSPADIHAGHADYLKALTAFLDAYERETLYDRTQHMIAFVQWKFAGAATKRRVKMLVKQGGGDDSGGDGTGAGGEGEGEGAGGADAEMADTLDDVDLAEGAAISTLADDTVVLASNLGPLASASAFGSAYDIGLVKSWQAIGDERTRRDHDEANGQTLLLDDPFEVGGEELMFPMDTSMGATDKETRFCRCVVTFDVDLSTVS